MSTKLANQMEDKVGLQVIQTEAANTRLYLTLLLMILIKIRSELGLLDKVHLVYIMSSIRHAIARSEVRGVRLLEFQQTLASFSLFHCFEL